MIVSPGSAITRFTRSSMSARAPVGVGSASEHHDVAAVHVVQLVAQLVDEDAVADLERGHHRPRRDVERLEQERLDDTGPTIHGVGACLDAWSLEKGSMSLGQGGKFELEVEGLLIASGPFTGTTGPVIGIDAALFCGADTNTTPGRRPVFSHSRPMGTRRSKPRSRCRAAVSRRSSCSTSRKVIRRRRRRR